MRLILLSWADANRDSRGVGPLYISHRSDPQGRLSSSEAHLMGEAKLTNYHMIDYTIT